MTREELIKDITHQAGAALLTMVPDSGVEDKKGRGNYVTAGDKKSEEIIVSAITKNFPADVILSEETDSELSHDQLLKCAHLWIIDPIDGTAGFRHQRKYSAVSVAYAEQGQLQLSSVYDPFRQEDFFAKSGQGAFRNNNKISVSQLTDLTHATIYATNAYDPNNIRRHLEALLKIPVTPWTLIKDSAALEMCEVAAGQADLFFSFMLKPWDTAAPMLLLQEAGAQIVNNKGEQVTFFSPEIIAGNPTLVQQFVDIIR